jgi:hypothetical protein
MEGRMFVDSELFCDMLEDRDRDLNKDGDLADPGEGKVFGETAIPYGRFRVGITWSPIFKKWMIQIFDVPGYEGIRIHWGRTAKNSKGCPLAGKKAAPGVLDNDGSSKKLTEMVDAAEKRGEEIWINIIPDDDEK